MSQLTLITGGCRSGKSRYAVQKAKEFLGDVVYVATCHPQDDEMSQRVTQHRQERPSSWKTIEGESDLTKIVQNQVQRDSKTLLLIDCLTLWISNHLISGRNRKSVLEEVERTLHAIQSYPESVIVVTNEVGLGIVPENPLAREFRDLAGEVNQRFAQSADEVVLMVCGIPLVVKKIKIQNSKVFR